jgi:long-chain acyl-CoA synthetase
MNRHKNYPLYPTVEFRDFRELMEKAATLYGNNAAISYKKSANDSEVIRVSYNSVRDIVRDLGTEELSLRMNRRQCAIIGGTSLNWILSYYSLMASGAITVPLDKDMPAADMAATLEKAEVYAVFYSPEVAAKVDHLRQNCPAKIYVCLGDKLSESAEAAGDVLLSTLIKKGAKKYAEGDNIYYDNELEPDDLASIVFTSGTTGKGKGVMLSQTNIAQDMTQGMYNFSIYSKKSDYSRTLCVLPPHHTFCSTIIFVGHFALGCEFYITSGIKYLLRELQEQKPTHLVLVPLFVETLYRRIWATAEKSGSAPKLKKGMKISGVLRKVGIDLRKKLFAQVTNTFGGHLEMVICGGAALNQDIIDFFDAVGITILNGYGISECAPLISCNRNEWQKNGSVGTPIITEKVKIDQPNSDGEGEICVKGPNVMLGYYKDPEATAAVFDKDGYFHTGDLGKLDDDGWLYITGRKKNLIIFSNGKNVYPEEIECEISRIRGVAEVVVYAGESRQNPEKEVIVAEIYPNYEQLEGDGVCSEREIEDYFNNHVREANTRMAPYKKVGFVKIRKEEFIKNTSRKITRFNIDKSID